MPEYLAPGVYVEEIEIGAKPIEGVSTSTAGFLGYAERGQLDKPTLVTSFPEFQRNYGGLMPADFNGKDLGKIRWLAYAVQGFFENGGKRVFVTRVADREKAKPATGFLPKVVDKNEKTTLAKEAKADDGALELDGAGWESGATLLIKDEIKTEVVTIGEKTKKVVLKAPVKVAYDAGAEVAKAKEVANSKTKLAEAVQKDKKEIKLADDKGFKKKDWLLIKGNNGEVIRVKAISDDKKNITTDGELRFDHAKNAEVIKLEKEEPALKLTKRVIQNAETLYLDQPDKLKANDNIILESDYLTVKALEDVLPVTPTLRYGHAKGTEVLKIVPYVKIKAASAGTWGEAVKMVVKQVNFAVTRLEKAAKNTDTLYLETLNNIKPGTVLKITSGEKTAEVLVKETNKTAKDNIAILAQPLAGEFPEDAEVKSLEFDLTAIEGENIETFINLSLIREHPRYIENIITDKSSGLIRVEKVENPEPGELNPVPSQAWNWRLEEGANGFPGDVSSYSDINVIYEGKDDLEPDKRTGLYTFKNVDEINIAAIPGITSSYLQKKIIIHCEIDMRDRFGVLDPNPLADLDEIKRQRTFYDSSYAALYYPWVYAFDPLSRSYINMPPSGHVCGVYARTDIERGVHKAPANEKINGIFGLEKLNGKFRIVNKGSQDILNPLGVNCIRQFPGRGIRVWGARTVTSNTLWKYVSVRRLFLYMEESIEKGTQWVVFEPNDAKLWARVIQTITQFLTGVWKDGALMGATPEEAFFIKCDRTTMTQDDIDNGRLICLIGVAPVKPAEFVIFRIAQWQGGSAATE